MISENIQQAAELLSNEGIVAIPTETVYGLAGSIYSEKAIRHIFELKKRPLVNPLIVHIGSKEQLENVVETIPELAHKLMDHFWPGPLTLVLKKKSTIPDLITAGKDTVAVRMPNHPITLKLLNLLSFPLAAPSANPSSAISPTSASHVDAYFGEELPMVLEGGACRNGIESTIIGFEGELPVLYRLGSLAVEEIEAVIGPIAVKNFDELHPNAPGMMAKHYAPKTVTVLSDDLQASIDLYSGKKIGLLLFDKKVDHSKVGHQEVLSPTGDLKEAASKLYAALHRLDALNLEVIITETFPDSYLGRAINDRLKRAAHQLQKI